MNQHRFILLILGWMFLFAIGETQAKPQSVPQKWVHVAPDHLYNVLINDLALDGWMGTDGVVADFRSAVTTTPYLGIYSAPYIERHPDKIYPSELEQVMRFPFYSGIYELQNEGDLYGVTPEAAGVRITENVAKIMAVNPKATIIVQMGSQIHFVGYSSAVWNELSPATKANIDAISFHYYPATLDPQEIKQYVRGVVRPWMNERGIANAYLTETGLDAARYTQDQAAAYIPQMWDALDDFPWLKAITWYMANGETGYVVLTKYEAPAENGKLTKAGRAWRDLP